MQFSYSKVDCFNKCPYQFKLRYMDKLKTYDEYEAQDALKLGTALHTGIEKDIQTAIDEYYNSYPIISDLHINEAIKLEIMLKKTRSILPLNDAIFEYELNTEHFKGFIDMLVPINDFEYDMYDFKYSNNVDKYMQSPQLSVYKYYFEKLNPGKYVRNMYFVFVPKTFIRQKKTEDLYQFRKRLIETLETLSPKVVSVNYDFYKVVDFIENQVNILTCKDYVKNEIKLCDWCEYQAYCKNKEELNMLPSTQRVEVETTSKKKIWIYGQPFSGKTTFADKAPTPLNLNTDGNVKYVTMPRVPIKDEITTEGRITNRKFAWDVFKDTISELEKGSDFETIVVDLLEDTYEFARLYIFDKYNIEHESDSGFGKGWDLVRTEFLTHLKRLLNLDYNIILISHEDTSKDFTKKGGDKITSVQPNINEKVAKKIAGMVDIVLRAVEGNGKYTLNFKSDEFTFGGGRLQGIKAKEIDSDWDELCAVYDDAIGNVEKPKTAHQQKVEDFKNAHQPAEQAEDEQPTTVTEPEQTEEAPKRRTRRTRG